MTHLNSLKNRLPEALLAEKMTQRLLTEMKMELHNRMFAASKKSKKTVASSISIPVAALTYERLLSYSQAIDAQAELIDRHFRSVTTLNEFYNRLNTIVQTSVLKFDFENIIAISPSLIRVLRNFL